MDIEKIRKKILDSSPRQLYHEVRLKFLNRKTDPASVDGYPVLFVLSTGRAGTETLNALFEFTGNILSYHEPAPTLYRLSRVAYENKDDPLAGNILRESFLTARQDLLNYSLQCHRGYVETSPQATFLARVIRSVIPQARFIHLVRDPRDVIRSGMRRKWYDGHSNDETRITPRPDSSYSLKWNQYEPFQKNVWLWTETNRWIMEFTAQIPPDGVLTIRSEDVFSMDQKTLRSLYEFIGAEVPQFSKISRLLEKKMNAQKTGEFPAWAFWTAEQRTILTDMASGVAARLGYDLSMNNE
jgi:hypothetical protein